MTALLRLVAADGRALDRPAAESSPQQEEPTGFARVEDLERLKADLDRLARIVERLTVLMAHRAGVPAPSEPQLAPPVLRLMRGGRP